MTGMPDWKEWSTELTEDQRKYKLYEVLTALSIHDCARVAACQERYDACQIHFNKLEKRKWFDRGVAVVSGGITGVLTALGIKINQ